MIELTGKYNSAKVFTDNVEQEAISQIIQLLNQEFTSGSNIRIMPDTHAGAGSTIGTTMTIKDKVIPYMVGVDIGCGMETVILNEKSIDLEQLDNVIHNNIPAGFSVRENPKSMSLHTDVHKLRCIKHINSDRAYKSIGTLGGGNHFIEVDKDDDGRLYLVIHSGSRYLGKQVADYYQSLAMDNRIKMDNRPALEMIALLKSQGRENEIQEKLRELPASKPDRELVWLEGEYMDDYLHDMAIAQEYAEINRRCIAGEIIKNMGLSVEYTFHTIHNYIDIENRILRKGAVSAQNGEKILIPINMRDGSLLCIGKGNPDWNWSAPHGAGRIMSRAKAKATITLSEYENAMKGIYSTTIDSSTLDEAPFAYKPIEEILGNIQETATVDKIIRPIYNFKASDIKKF